MKADNKLGRAVATAAVTIGALVLTVLMLDIRTAGAQGSTSIRGACDPADPAVMILANTRQGTDPTGPGYWPGILYVWAVAGTDPAPAVGDPIPLGPGEQARIPWPAPPGSLGSVSWATGVAPNGVWWPSDTITVLHGPTCGDPDLVDQTTSTTAPTTSASPSTTTSSRPPVGAASAPDPIPPQAVEPGPAPTLLTATNVTLPKTGPERTGRITAAGALLLGVGLALTLSIPITRKVRP